MGEVWEVIGGADKGGILVRQGPATTDKAEDDRLSHGARVEEIEVRGDRLHYKLRSGSGPKEGWVAVRISNKELCVRVSDSSKTAASPVSEEPLPDHAARCLQPACRTAAKFLANKPLGPFKKTLNKKRFLEDVLAKRLTGDMYGLPFPQTPEELFTSEAFGLAWLNKAFHTAGSLPKDNSIKRILTWKRFIGGGSGPKAVFDVEYEHASSDLDSKLFLKMPHPKEENADQRYLECGQARFGDNWGGELLFYRYLAPKVPFPCPKLYFGDVCRESTEGLLINACVDWPEDGKTEFQPYEILPPCGKCEDYTLKSPHEYYYALMRRLGTFSGLGKAEKLGDEVDELSWLHCTATSDINLSIAFPGNEVHARTLIEEVVPHWFEAKLRTKAALDKLCQQLVDICAQQDAIVKFMYADPLYIGFHHQNGNTDNAYFYKRDDGRIDCGLYDWGSTARMCYLSGLMGCFVSAQAEMLAEHEERLIKIWLDAYHDTGAPRLSEADFLFRYRLATAVQAYGICGSAKGLLVDGVKDSVAKTPAYNCPEITSNFFIKFQTSMLYNRLTLLLLKGDVFHDAVKAFSAKHGKKA
mmetsp:Transcript_11520/g.26724  ORF Transcript_11520/g.26724 Transcript_11520/m.26724 type:complete len:584 (-) Transcript_11520:49-1800(-)